MSLHVGTHIGPYQVTAAIGAGGMGEVYRARDARLERDVAIKVMPELYAADADRLARFEQEARAASALAHPNILVIYDVGHHEGAPFVVSELLEGDSLRDRIGEAGLPPRKVVELGTQIAQGLAAAHAKGIVHRDLKPENVFVTRDGVVKILDFGLAKLTRPEPAGLQTTEVATRPARTGPGVVLGTVGYMSPEQVRGQVVDHRSDIFSFGAVLYEVLTGQRAFGGDSAVETMNAILNDDPQQLAEPSGAFSPGLLRVVAHCLEKRPEERFQSARDLAFALAALSAPSDLSAPRQAALATRREARWLRWFPAALLLPIAVAALLLGQRLAEQPVPSFHQLTFRKGRVQAARFSPDGHTIFYSASWGGLPTRVYSTRLDTVESQPLDLPSARLVAATGGELTLILLRSSGLLGTLARVPIGSSAPREIQEAVYEADCASDGESFLVVRETEGRELLEYPLGTVLCESGGWFSWPRISPNDGLVAFIDHPVGGDTRGTVAVVGRDGRKRTLTESWNDPGGLAWSPDGKEVWFTAAQSGSARALWAVTLTGRQRLVARVTGRLILMDISRDGRVLLTHPSSRREVMLRGPGEARERDYSWFDATVAVDISADGQLFLFSESGEGGGPRYSVYLRATDGSPPVRLGEGLAQSLSPDGEWALSLLHTTPPQLLLLPSGPGESVTLPRGPISQYHWGCWTPGGKSVLFVGNEPEQPQRVYLQDVPDGAPRPVTPAGVTAPRSNTVSPDGRLFAGTCPQGVGERYCLWPVGGGDPEPIQGLQRREEPLGWAADGRTLLVRGDRDALPLSVTRLDPTTGRREPFLAIGPADTAGVSGISGVFFARDGEVYVYHYARSLSDLFLVEGLR